MMDQIHKLLGAEFSERLIGAILLLVGSLILGWLLKRFLDTIGRKLIAKTKTDLDDKLLAIILPRIKWLSTVVGAYLAAEEITKAFRPHEITALQFIGYAKGVIFVGFVWAVTALSLRLVIMFLRHFMEEHAEKTGSGYSENLLPLLTRVVSIVIISFAVLTVLGQFGLNISSVLVFLGGSSVAIALAAQETLSNMIAGFVIMIDRPFRVGDRVKLPSGEVGDVSEIGLRTTHILDFDHNMIISPNGELVKAKVINYSYPHLEVRLSIEVGVAYGTSVEKARKIMLDLAGRHPNVLKKPAPDVFLVALADSSVNLLLVARTDDFKKQFVTETMLREQIYNAFLKKGIDIPFPQRVVHLTKK